MRRRSAAAAAPTRAPLLGLGIHDLTGGFKVFRREVLEAIDLPSLASLGYAFQVETTYRALRRGFRVVEVPIVFRDRRVGRVEDEQADRAEAAWRVPCDAPSRVAGDDRLRASFRRAAASTILYV